jgi:hypothetical protein
MEQKNEEVPPARKTYRDPPLAIGQRRGENRKQHCLRAGSGMRSLMSPNREIR